MTATLSAHELTIRYESGGSVVDALGPLTFNVPASTFVTVVGPSGCGKSTLIRAFAGLQQPSSGAATIDGTPITEPSSRVGLMFQDANLMPWRTVIDNVALPLELAGRPQRERHAVARELLPTLGLQDFEASFPGELSGGMAQRVALGRVLIQRPDVLLLDEPFGALDALTREQVSLDLLKTWANYRQTAFMVTHDINEAVLLADRVLVLSRRPGRVLADVPVPLPRPRELRMIYESDFADVAQHIRAAINSTAAG